MNKVMLIGRLTKDAEIRYNNDMAIARFTLAVDRIKEGTDFINCIAFGKLSTTIEKYTSKGQRIAVEGRIQTGSYAKQDGTKVYTTDVVVERMDLLGSKPKEDKQAVEKKELNEASNEGFMQIDDALEDEGLPFN